MINNELELLEKLNFLYARNEYIDILVYISKYENLIEKKYYEICKLKLIALIELDKLIDASILIKEELSVAYVPKEFEKFLIEKRNEVSFLLRDKQRQKLTFDDLESIDKLDNDGLLAVLPLLKEFNLNPLVNRFQIIFNNNSISNLTKSLLIACLSDNKIDHKFEVIKEDTLIKFNPISVFDIRNSDNLIYLKKEMNKLPKLDINVSDILNKLLVTYLLDIYPLVISEDCCDELLVACILLINNMMSCNVKSDKMAEILTKRAENVTKMTEKLNILIESV